MNTFRIKLPKLKKKQVDILPNEKAIPEAMYCIVSACFYVLHPDHNKGPDPNSLCFGPKSHRS